MVEDAVRVSCVGGGCPDCAASRCVDSGLCGGGHGCSMHGDEGVFHGAGAVLRRLVMTTTVQGCGGRRHLLGGSTGCGGAAPHSRSDGGAVMWVAL